LPNTWDNAEFHLMALEGCLCLSHFSCFQAALDIWVMKEYGVKKSWTKLFTLSIGQLVHGNFYIGIVAITYLKSDNKVLVYNANEEVYWHDLDKKTDENVEINEWASVSTVQLFILIVLFHQC